jgi:hypothetical protein
MRRPLCRPPWPCPACAAPSRSARQYKRAPPRPPAPPPFNSRPRAAHRPRAPRRPRTPPGRRRRGPRGARARAAAARLPSARAGPAAPRPAARAAPPRGGGLAPPGAMSFFVDLTLSDDEGPPQAPRGAAGARAGGAASRPRGRGIYTRRSGGGRPGPARAPHTRAARRPAPHTPPPRFARLPRPADAARGSPEVVIVDAGSGGGGGARRPLAPLRAAAPQPRQPAAPQGPGFAEGEELVITGEAGVDARRNLPHTRDQCGRHPFSKAGGDGNRSFCDQARGAAGARGQGCGRAHALAAVRRMPACPHAACSMRRRPTPRCLTPRARRARPRTRPAPRSASALCATPRRARASSGAQVQAHARRLPCAAGQARRCPCHARLGRRGSAPGMRCSRPI